MECEVRRMRGNVKDAIRDCPANAIALQLAVDLSDGSIMIKIHNPQLITQYNTEDETLIIAFPEQVVKELISDLGKGLKVIREMKDASGVSKPSGSGTAGTA